MADIGIHLDCPTLWAYQGSYETGCCVSSILQEFRVKMAEKIKGTSRAGLTSPPWFNFRAVGPR